MIEIRPLRPDDWPAIEDLFGPRGQSLERKRVYRTPWNDKTWSITCFVIAREAQQGHRHSARPCRRRARLRERCRVVEGYPALTPRDGKALPPVFAWTGVTGVFQRAGFKPHPENPRVWVADR